MSALSAPLLFILRPMQLPARALLAEIRSERLHLEEPQQGEELSDTVLNGRPGKTPFVCRLEREARLGHTCRALLDGG